MTIWLTARGAGLAALLLLTISTCLGALMSGRASAAASGGGPIARADRAANRVVLQYVHRAAATLGLGVLVLHIATILADAQAKVGVTGALIPFTSGYRATWVGLGTIAAYLIVAVAALGFARGRLASSARAAPAWRAVHAIAYVAWVFAIVHGFKSGTDSHVGWVELMYLGCLIAVGAAIAIRLNEPAVTRTENAPATGETVRTREAVR